MVNSSQRSDEIGQWGEGPRVRRVRKHGRLIVSIRFTDALYDQIVAEAIRRGWNFSQMVRHLCEASIEGIE